ncbi:MAG: hypothetical protein N2D54_02230 [Chloroflexota bacterium]
MTVKQLTLNPEIDIPAHLVGEVQAKLAYVDEAIATASVTENGNEIVLSLKATYQDAQAKEISEKVLSVVNEMAKGSFKPKVEVLEDFRDRLTPYNQDPMETLFEMGEVSEEATGIFTFGPLMAQLTDYFESRFMELADYFEAKPYRFPTLMSAKMLDRVEYFNAFPHSLTFATHLRSDLDVINHFAEHAKYQEGGLNASMDKFSKIEALLSPAVCYHLYFSLADHPLPEGQLIATAVGNCFRYESSNMTTLERLWNFTMREIIFVGSKDFVLENREKARLFMQNIFEELGLAYHVETANDPFFVGEFRKQAAFQNAFQLKYEIRAKLPFKDETLAVGSYNYHQNFFGRNLNIELPDGTPIHTGCTAFGLERMVYAFLSQYGFAQSQWPAVVREALE